MKSILSRWAAPTPKFFKKVRNIGLVIGAIGTAIITAPISLPVMATTIAGYMVATGGVLTAVSQMAVADDELSTPSTQEDGK
jgi:hypothetical protein